MDAIKVCPNCQFANPLDSTLCARCNMNLVPLLTARLTPTIPAYVLNTPPPDHEHFVSRLQADTLLFIVAGEEKPIFFKKSRSIMLGRNASSESTQGVDFTSANAFYLGVSRQHAVIECLKEGCFIRDLESTNGTWVNEKQLVPNRAYKLRSSDLIRLGQMGVYLYFRAELVSQMHCVIRDVATASIQLTPDYLTHRLGPYLITLSRIQQIVDMALERTQLLLVIKAMHIDPDTKYLYVDLFANTDLLDFLRDKVGKWRQEHSADITILREMEESVTWLRMDTRSDPIAPGYAELRQKLHPSLSQLVRQCLAELAPDLAEKENALYVSRLLPAFTRLVHSPLYIAQAPVVEPYG
jgi:hypothetical protein